MKSFDMHLIAVLGAIAVCAGLSVPVVWIGREASAGPDLNLADMESIEAELAMKSEEAPKQPQKPKSAPVPLEDEAVGGDAKAAPETCKTDAQCAQGKVCRESQCVRSKPNATDVPPDLTKFKHRTDDDEEPGNSTPIQLGAFDGDEFGWASGTKGDPFYIQLVKDLREGWEYPKILSDQGSAMGCFRIAPNGEISDTQVKEKSGNSELDDSVERAMISLKKRRSEHPIQVPTHLLNKGDFLCLRFNPTPS